MNQKFSIKTTCKICQIGRATLYRYINKGVIPQPHVDPIDHRKRFFNESELKQIKKITTSEYLK